MSDSKLIKDWKEKDVQRMRNIITKKNNNKTNVQVGYQKINIIRVENEIWEEDGKKWTLKNGIKQNITKLDNVKKLIQLPLTCPKCHHSMNNDKFNKHMYLIHKMCFNCVIEFETELKRLGKFEEYQRNIIQQGVISYVNDLEQMLFDLTINENISESYITEAGDKEEWIESKEFKTKAIKELTEYIKQIKSNISM